MPRAIYEAADAQLLYFSLRRFSYWPQCTCPNGLDDTRQDQDQDYKLQRHLTFWNNALDSLSHPLFLSCGLDFLLTDPMSTNS